MGTAESVTSQGHGCAMSEWISRRREAEKGGAMDRGGGVCGGQDGSLAQREEGVGQDKLLSFAAHTQANPRTDEASAPWPVLAA